MRIKKYKNWLSDCINKRTDEFYTIDSLIAAGEMSDSERRFLPANNYPYRELISMHRVQIMDKSEWLVKTKQ